MKVVDCTVDSIEALTPTVYKIILKPNAEVQFLAGQYCQVVMGVGDKRPFSIANAAYQADVIELHIGAEPTNAYAFEVLEKCKNERQLTLEVALGDAFLRESTKPAIIIAGGTGYSYAKSIVSTCLHQQPNRKISLYWGAKTSADLYEMEELSAMSALHENFNFYPVIENIDEQTKTSWDAHTGLVHKAVMKDVDDLSGYQVYAAGRFEMSAAIRDDFTPLGLHKDDLFGDAYAFI